MKKFTWGALIVVALMASVAVTFSATEIRQIGPYVDNGLGVTGDLRLGNTCVVSSGGRTYCGLNASHLSFFADNQVSLELLYQFALAADNGVNGYYLRSNGDNTFTWAAGGSTTTLPWDNITGTDNITKTDTATGGARKHIGQTYTVNPTGDPSLTTYTGYSLSTVVTGDNTQTIPAVQGSYSSLVVGSISDNNNSAIVTVGNALGAAFANYSLAANGKGLDFSSSNFGTMSGFLYGLQGAVSNWSYFPKVGTVNTARAGRFRVSNFANGASGQPTGTAAVTTAQALYANFEQGRTGGATTNATTGTAVGFQYDISNGAGGTITNSYGINLTTPVNSGTITNHWGIYLDNQVVPGSTFNYALYSNGGNWFIQDNVEAENFIGPLEGNAATATRLAATGTQCSGGQFSTGIDNAGNANCGTPAGGGDFSGPASSTDNALVIFDGTGGKTGKNSPCTVGVDNVLTCPGGFNTTQSATEAGRSDWYELSGNGTNRVGFGAPDNVTETYRLIMPPAKGTVGQTLKLQPDNVSLSWGTTSGAMPNTYSGLIGNPGPDNVTQAHYSATWVVFDDGTMLPLDNTVVDITVSGLGGRAEGTEGVSEWWYVHAVAADNNAVGLVMSKSSTGPTMPSGYTRKCLLGPIYNNVSGNFELFHQRERYVAIYTQVLNDGNSTTITPVSLTGAIPPTAKRIYGYAHLYSAGNSANMHVRLCSTESAYADPVGFFTIQYNMSSAVLTRIIQPFSLGIITPQTIWYYTDNGANHVVDIDITGYSL